MDGRAETCSLVRLATGPTQDMDDVAYDTFCDFHEYLLSSVVCLYSGRCASIARGGHLHIIGNGGSLVMPGGEHHHKDRSRPADQTFRRGVLLSSRRMSAPSRMTICQPFTRGLYSLT